MKRLVALAASVFALVLAGTAFALTSRALHISQPVPAYPGSYFSVSGRGCLDGDTVQLTSTLFRNHTFGNVGTFDTTARKGNVFSARVRIPKGTKAGTYKIGVRCGGGNLGLIVKLHVA